VQELAIQLCQYQLIIFSEAIGTSLRTPFINTVFDKFPAQIQMLAVSSLK
jgi:hypothetical protein